MKIGLRTVKTGIAVALALMVSQMLQLESVIFITIAALIGMQPTVSDSWLVGAKRISGTIAGTIFGLLMALLIPSHFLLAGLGVVLLIMFMNRLKIPEGITISCVVFISIYMNTQNDIDIASFALSRLVDTFMGISIALMVNYFILPPKYDRRAMIEMRKDMARIMTCQNRMLGVLLGKEDLAASEMDRQIEEILDELNESKKLAEMQEKEEKLNVYGQILCEEINLVLRITTDMYQHLKNLYGLLESGLKIHNLQPVEPELMALYDKLKQEEASVQTDSKRDPVRMKALMEDIAQLKRRLKTQEVSNQLGAEEIVKLMVLVYNIGEIISKMDMISSKHYS